MLLTTAEAEHIAQAWAYLNNCCAVAHVRVLRLEETIHVKTFKTDTVEVWRTNTLDQPDWPIQQERYRNQAAFQEAYGLDA